MSKKNLILKAGEPAPVIDWALVDSISTNDIADDDSPELTTSTLRQLRPIGEVLPDALPGKTRITIMLDNAVLQAYKKRAGGRGYQTLINETLRRGVEIEGIADVLRQVIREEVRR